MDILAAIALVMVIEGLALAMFSKSMPALIAEIQAIGQERLRRVGLASIAVGGLLYLAIRAA